MTPSRRSNDTPIPTSSVRRRIKDFSKKMLEQITCMYICPRKILSSLNRIFAKFFFTVENSYGLACIFEAMDEVNEVDVCVGDDLNSNDQNLAGECIIGLE